MTELGEIHPASLCADLDAAGQRRLWLVRLLLTRSNCEPAEVLELAARFESFIHRSAASPPSEVEVRETEPTPQVLGEIVAPRHADSTSASADHDVRPVRGRVPLLDQNTRERFLSVALSGADNRDLARQFRLTVRQAHAVRLSLARQNPQVKQGLKPANGAASAPGLSRAEELTLQEEFLRRRPLPKPTIDDVIRYVRQRGDTVVCRDGRYLVNGRSLLSADELVHRANRYRESRGDSPFKLDAEANSVVDASHPAQKPTVVGHEYEFEPDGR